MPSGHHEAPHLTGRCPHGGDIGRYRSRRTSATVIDNVTPFDTSKPDRIKVTVGKLVSIDMEEAQIARPLRRRRRTAEGDRHSGKGKNVPRVAERTLGRKVPSPSSRPACRLPLPPAGGTIAGK
jgi:hypothetical protein